MCYCEAAQSSLAFILATKVLESEVYILAQTIHNMAQCLYAVYIGLCLSFHIVNCSDTRSGL